MHKRFFTICLFSILTAISIHATELKVPRNTGRIVDLAGTLSSSDKSKIEMAIMQFEQATAGQMEVLIIPSLRGDSLEMFSMRVAENWKLGYKGKDNGLLLLISVKEHKIRLEVGYGFEGTLNDARAGDIIRGMQPFFRANRYGDGIVYAVMRSQEFITGKEASSPIPHVRNRTSSSSSAAIVKIIIFFIIYFVIFLGNRRRRGFTLLSGGYYGGYSGRSAGGFGGSGGFSGGGGGSFGGGGASGGW